MVAEARAERDELALAKAAAEQRAAELESTLSAALSDLESARAQGTPGGEAAKRVAQLSMQKLRGLQQVNGVWVVGMGRQGHCAAAVCTFVLQGCRIVSPAYPLCCAMQLRRQVVSAMTRLLAQGFQPHQLLQMLEDAQAKASTADKEAEVRGLWGSRSRPVPHHLPGQLLCTCALCCSCCSRPSTARHPPFKGSAG